MLIDDEHDLRAGLRALGAPVPPPPPDARAQRAVALARRIRRRRAAVTGALVLLPAVAVGAAVLRPTPPPAVDLTNVANWPERRDPGLAAIERNVFTEWAYGPLDGLGPDERVRWLYSGRVPGADSVVVAFATCRPDQCTRTVLAYGDQAEMAEPPKDDSMTDWITRTREVAPGEPVGALSAYLRSANRPEQGHTNVLFVLAAPDAEQVTYVAPTRDGSGATSGPLAPAAGAFAGDVGYLEANAVVTVTRGDGSVVHEGPVGDDDSVGHARLIRGLEPPRGYTHDGATSGQLPTPFRMVDRALSRTVPHTLLVRCIGDGPLRVELNGTKGTVPCDGRPHRATPLVAPVMVGDFDEEREEQAAFEYSLSSDDPYTVFVAALARPA